MTKTVKKDKTKKKEGRLKKTGLMVGIKRLEDNQEQGETDRSTGGRELIRPVSEII